MNLKSLYINRQAAYDKFPGMLTGKVTFDSPDGELSINIRPEASGQLLKLLAGELCATTQVVAENLARDIIAEANGQLLENRS